PSSSSRPTAPAAPTTSPPCSSSATCEPAVTTSSENRRAEPRLPVHFEVDCASGDTFLYAYVTDISSMGIFIHTDTPLPVGTTLRLGFTPAGQAASGAAPQRLELTGEVMWNTTAADKPGMGVRFHHAAP